MRILDRLVVGQFLRLFLLAVVATPPLFMLGEFTEDIDRYVDLGLTGADVARAYVFRLPEYIVWAFPIAGLIAAIFTVHSMTAHREIVAAKAGGISFHRLALPILLVGALLTVTGVALTEVVPRSNRIAFQILRKADLRAEWRMDFVYRSDAGYTLAARRLTLLDSRLTGVVVQQLGDDNGVPTIHIEATEAEHTTEAGWTFLDGYLRLVRNDGPESAYHFDRMRLPALTEVPAELLDTPPEEDEMTSAELERMARVVERSGGKPHRLRVKKDQRVAIPAATLVIILFGVPLATSSKRGGTAYGIGAALGTTIVYLLLFKVVGSFGMSGVIRPDIAAWSPNVLFLLAGLFLMARVRT